MVALKRAKADLVEKEAQLQNMANLAQGDQVQILQLQSENMRIIDERQWLRAQVPKITHYLQLMLRIVEYTHFLPWP